MYKAYNIITPNADLPIKLEAVKQHLNMDDLSHADEVIMAYTFSAVKHIEVVYGMAMLTQTVKEYWSAFPCTQNDPMLLRIQPVQSITSIVYVDEDGLSQTWDADEWTSGGYNGTTFITPNPGYSWPSTWNVPNAICITYQAGFGDTPASLPWDIGQAVKFMAADMFAKREDSPQTFVRASENLLRPYYRYPM